jgi:hypothetical protein
MPRRKRQPEQFDVAEFLRESDDDLKSALNSLLRSPAPTNVVDTTFDANLGPGPTLREPRSLDPSNPEGTEAGPNLIPGPDSRIGSVESFSNSSPGSNLAPGPNLDPGLKLTEPSDASRDESTGTGSNPEPTPIQSAPGPILVPPPNLRYGLKLTGAGFPDSDN